eukprot:Awhi_evm1s4629
MFVNGNWVSRRNGRANAFYYEKKHQNEGGTPADKSFYEFPEHPAYCSICINEWYFEEHQQERAKKFEKGKKTKSVNSDYGLDLNMHTLSVDSSDSLVGNDITIDPMKREKLHQLQKFLKHFKIKKKM